MEGAAAFDILVLGDTVEAWLAAASLARSIGKAGRTVGIVPLPSEPDVQPVLALPPGIAALHGLLGFDERDLMRFCQGSFRLGTLFDGWNPKGVSFVRAYGEPPAFPGEGALHQHWQRSANTVKAASFEAFSLGALLGKEDRFAHPDPDATAQAGSFDYGYHLDTDKYRDYLKRAALHYGARLVPGDMQDIAKRDKAAGISAIRLTDGQDLSAQLFVDATGTGRIAELMKAGDWLPDDTCPFDRIAVRPVQAESLSLERIRATDDAVISDVAMPAACFRTALFNRGAVPEGLGKPAAEGAQDLRTGYRMPWAGNLVSVGASAFRVMPIDAGDMCLAVKGIQVLLELVPEAGAVEIAGREYNRRMMMAYGRLRDMQTMALALARRPWSKSAGALSEENQIRLDQFASRGRVVTFDEETFTPSEWTSMMLGLGVVPRRTDPSAAALSVGDAAKRLDALSDYVAGLVQRYPRQLEYLQAADVLTAEGGAKS